MVGRGWGLSARWRVSAGTTSGSVLEWRGSFGWIWPDDTIDHPEALKHGARVYVHIKDVLDRAKLSPGARVCFQLYSDGNGIGAEQVSPEEAADTNTWSRSGRSSPWRRVEWQSSAPLKVHRTIDKWSQSPAGKGKGKGPTGEEKGKGSAAKNASPGNRLWGSRHNGKGGAAPACVLVAAPGPDREKKVRTGAARPWSSQDCTMRWASVEMRGWRPAMEDASVALTKLPAPFSHNALFAVFDGHGGAAVSARAAEEIPGHLAACGNEILAKRKKGAAGSLSARSLEAALPSWDALLRRDGDGKPGFLRSAGGGDPIPSDVLNEYGLTGSTAVLAMLECDGPPAKGMPQRVVVANLGDSRALLCRAGVAVALSDDHKPELPVERDRIERAGGSVGLVGPCYRVDGWGLNLSRALGDFHYKGREDLPAASQKVSCMPDVQSMDLTEEDEFLFLGCDGVFELHSNQSAVDHVRAGLLEGKALKQVVQDFVDSCCSSNLSQTLGQGGDNVSAVVVLLR